MTHTALFFRDLFRSFDDAGYEFTPLTPDRFLALRKAPEPFRPLVRRFGLGLPVSDEELIDDGLEESLAQRLKEFEATEGPLVISWGASLRYVPHSLWPPRPGKEGEFVHFAGESLKLTDFMEERVGQWVSCRTALDLGCSSGGLMFYLADTMDAERITGVDICHRAISWGRAAAEAQGLGNVVFHHGPAGTGLGFKPELIVFNPPMVLREKGQTWPHRDGGELGIELPLRFLQLSEEMLPVGGQVFCLVTNPVFEGKGAFFGKFKPRALKLIEKKCLNAHFNQNVARKRGYEELGVERIELWALWLRKT